MKPGRSDYETWFIDWLDGKLSLEEVKSVKAFLRENPDLEEEYNDLAAIHFKPSSLEFKGKKSLEKSVDDYSERQFEHLCIASLENDLSMGQAEELREITENDEGKRRTLETFRKLKLKPPSIAFKRKYLLRKLTLGQKVFRVTFAVMSAAAAITLLFLMPALVKSGNQQSAEPIIMISVNDTLIIERSYPVRIPEKSFPGDPVEKADKMAKTRNLNKSDSQIPLVAENTPVANPAAKEELARVEGSGEINVMKPVAAIGLDRPSKDDLVAWTPGYIPPLIDNRSNLAKSVAKFFHAKILKDPAAGTRPVETYEVAVAGIEGLNKFLGWEMALHKNTDENGDIKSYSFSSRLLKFKAPVKKSVKSL